MKGLVSLLAACLLASTATAAKLNMLINQSPWFDGFRKTLVMYEEETGETIELDVTPYPGMSEKIRNSIRSPEAIYDIVITSTEFMATYANSGEFVNFNDIDPDFKLDSGICGYQDTSYWDYIKISTFFRKIVRSFEAKVHGVIFIPREKLLPVLIKCILF